MAQGDTAGRHTCTHRRQAPSLCPPAADKHGESLGLLEAPQEIVLCRFLVIFPASFSPLFPS